MRSTIQRSILVACATAALFLFGSASLAKDEKPAAPVALNPASQKDLESLKGVGPATAKKIIAGRPYKSVDELSKAGIPAKTVESIKAYVTVGATSAAPAPAAKAPATAPAAPSTGASAPSTGAAAPATSSKGAAARGKSEKSAPAPKLAPGEKVNINTATKEKLDALPGIGPVKAQAIIDRRPYATIEDIKKVKGIKDGEFAKIKDLITVN